MKLFTLYIICLISLLMSSCAKVITYAQQQLDKNSFENKGVTPDYNDLRNWAASPFKVDSSDQIPRGVILHDTLHAADVFFIHPTTYISSNSNTYELREMVKNPFKGIKVLKNSPWNADIDDESVNIKTDMLSLSNQATVFNESCRVFAPRYRQANIKAFLVPKESINAAQAFDLAYQDLKNAFQFYLDHHHQGRPIVIASHSQGTLLAKRLLLDFFDGKPLLKNLVCAYLVGYKIDPNTFKTIPIGKTPDQTGCVVGWQSFNADAKFTEEVLQQFGNTIAVNPLSWTTGNEWITAEQNEVLIPDSGLVRGQVSARIEEHGLLMVKTPPTIKAWLKNADNFHVWDYNLFWMNIRQNVAQRIAAFNRQTKKLNSYK